MGLYSKKGKPIDPVVLRGDRRRGRADALVDLHSRASLLACHSVVSFHSCILDMIP